MTNRPVFEKEVLESIRRKNRERMEEDPLKKRIFENLTQCCGEFGAVNTLQESVKLTLGILVSQTKDGKLSTAIDLFLSLCAHEATILMSHHAKVQKLMDSMKKEEEDQNG